MSLQNFSTGLLIFSKYLPEGMHSRHQLGADHDEIYIYVSQEEIPAESDEGLKLQELGFTPHEGGNWSYNV